MRLRGHVYMEACPQHCPLNNCFIGYFGGAPPIWLMSSTRSMIKRLTIFAPSQAELLLVAGFQADRIGLQGPGIADFGAIA
jgi:hypothetical protein